MFNRTHTDARWSVTGTPLRDNMPVTGNVGPAAARAVPRSVGYSH